MAKKNSTRVNVKFAARAASSKTLSAVPGVLNVFQTFPEETDQELSCLYMVEVEPSRIKPALRELRAMPGVEYAEETAPRKLPGGVAHKMSK